MQTDVAQKITRVVVLVPDDGDRRVADVIASARADLPADEVELLDVRTGPEESRLEAARRAAQEHHAEGVFWFDLAESGEYLVYLHLPARDVTLRRRVPEAAESVEAAIEAMWIIVRSGTLSIARGVAVEMEAVDPATIEPKPPEPEPTPPPPKTPVEPPARPEEPERIGLWLSASYHGLGFARRVVWQSGGGVELSYAVHRLVKLGIGYGIVAGMRVRAPTELAIVRHEVAAVLGVGGLVGARVGLEGRLLPALELVQWRAPQSDANGLRPAAKLAAELLLRIVLVPRVTLDVAAGADVGLTSYTFVLCGEGAATCSGDARVTVLTPWRARPRARAGVSFVF